MLAASPKSNFTCFGDLSWLYSASSYHLNFSYNGSTDKNAGHLEKKSLELVVQGEPKFTKLRMVLHGCLYKSSSFSNNMHELYSPAFVQ